MQQVSRIAIALFMVLISSKNNIAGLFEPGYHKRKGPPPSLKGESPWLQTVCAA
jgi:hypothetical protein